MDKTRFSVNWKSRSILWREAISTRKKRATRPQSSYAGFNEEKCIPHYWICGTKSAVSCSLITLFEHLPIKIHLRVHQASGNSGHWGDEARNSARDLVSKESRKGNQNDFHQFPQKHRAKEFSSGIARYSQNPPHAVLGLLCQAVRTLLSIRIFTFYYCENSNLARKDIIWSMLCGIQELRCCAQPARDQLYVLCTSIMSLTYSRYSCYLSNVYKPRGGRKEEDSRSCSCTWPSAVGYIEHFATSCKARLRSHVYATIL